MIFCVEDDNGIRNMMVYTLNASGLEAEGFADGESFFEAAKTRLPDLVILDIMLPGEDGLTILRRLREKAATNRIPVIMATAKGTEYDKVLGLDMGADDYLVKPFGMMEMVSRVKAVLRRAAPAARINQLKIGGLELNLDEHTAWTNGQRIQLTLKEYELLRLFMENPGQVFNRDQLLSKVWEADFAGETRTVDVHIATLRTKLGEYAGYIETVRGVGYRLEEKV
ncbi:MAG: response regulator transcription factor [Oscillospiraceae bacterium]|nr:response regulator transcription factor [Oscillospiraceae bacterium]